jgi:hypothetical protein
MFVVMLRGRNLDPSVYFYGDVREPVAVAELAEARFNYPEHEATLHFKEGAISLLGLPKHLLSYSGSQILKRETISLIAESEPDTVRDCMDCGGRGAFGTMAIPGPGERPMEACHFCAGGGKEIIGGRFCDVPVGGMFVWWNCIFVKVIPYHHPEGEGNPWNAVTVAPKGQTGICYMHPKDRTVEPYHGNFDKWVPKDSKAA